MCALGVCPEELMHFTGHASSSSTSSSSRSMPNNPAVPGHHEGDPDCALHGHPSVFAEKVPNLNLARPGVVDQIRVHIERVAFLAAPETTAMAEVSGISGPAPPGALTIPLSQQTTVLRI
jgi:hypothetical protein